MHARTRPTRCAVALVLALAACSGGGSRSSGGPGGGDPSTVRVANVSASVGDGEVTLTWSPVAGALSYNLYWATTPGVTPENGDLVADVSSPQVLTVTNGVTYYVVITAVLGSGETAPSSEVSFTPSATATSGGGHVGVVTTIAGDGSMGYVDGGAIHAEFTEPTGLVAVGTDLYVCDTSNMLIRKVDLGARTVSTVAGYTTTYAGWADGVGTAAGFNAPRAIATDGAFLYVADTGNNLIRRLELATGAVTMLAGSRSTAGATDGPGSSATFRWPRGVATDGATLYVADTYNNAIRAIDLATGVVSTLAGDPSSYAGNVDAVGTAARFSAPNGLALWDGWLLVADNGNSAIRAVDLATREVVTVSTAATAPAGVAVIGDFAYVTNAAPGGGGDPVPGTGNTITEIDLLTGNAWVLAGGDWYDQWKDGTGTAAALNKPVGITATGGTLYFTDSLTHVVRQVELQAR